LRAASAATRCASLRFGEELNREEFNAMMRKLRGKED
jgi:hypothetical protein